MRTDTFRNQLIDDTSLVELKKYITGERTIERHIGTKREKEEFLNVFIPKLIIQREKENAEDVKLWYNAPLFRLAFQYCLQTRRPKSDLFDVAMNIIQKVNYDRKHLCLQNKFRNYYHCTKGVEII